MGFNVTLFPYYLPFGLQHNRKPYKQSFTIYSEDSLFQVENEGKSKMRKN